MLLSDISLKRPVFAIALSIALILVGFLSGSHLPIREYPAVSEARITVQTSYPGASADVMEQRVTKILEQGLSGIEGLDIMRSTNEPSMSTIDMSFRAGTNLETAAADVRERLARVQGDLPDEAKEPFVFKAGANDQPFLWMFLSSERHTVLQTTEYAYSQLQPYLQSLKGIAEVVVYGHQPSLQIRLSPEKMMSFGITAAQIDNLLKENVESPAGYIIAQERNINVMANSRLKTPQDYRDLVIQAQEGRIVRLGEVADISIAADIGPFQWEPEVNGKRVTIIGMKKTSTGNPLEISKEISRWLEQMNKKMPTGMKLQITYDEGTFIQKSLNAVSKTLLEAAVLVMLIIFLFLHSARASLIPLVTIPISLIGSLTFLYALGYTINTLTLLAMVLSIGLVVDDAIVVLENIHRYREQGLSAAEAALKGAREIGFAIIAMTITLAVVYAPIAFMSGMSGKFFAEFAVSLAGSVLVSGLVALTLTPVMCRYLIRDHKPGPFTTLLEHTLQRIFTTILSGVNRSLMYRPWVIVGMLGVIASGYMLFHYLPTMLGPEEDRGLITASANGPDGATIDFMDQEARKPLSALMQGIPEVESVFSMARAGHTFVVSLLKPWDQRHRSQQAILEELRQKVHNIPSVRTYVFGAPTILSGGEGGIQFVVRTFGSYEELEKTMQTFTETVRKRTKLNGVHHDIRLSTPQYMLSIDQDKAYILNVRPKDIQDTLRIMLSGSYPLHFEKDGRFYDVVLRVDTPYRKSLDTLSLLYVEQDERALMHDEEPDDKNAVQRMIPLSNLVTSELKAVAGELKHFNMMRSATLNADLTPDISMGEALSQLTAIAQEILPPGMMMDLDGFSRAFLESNLSMLITFLSAFAFIYLILAVQFESFIDPFIILFSVPLSLTGGLFALWISGNSLNIFSQVGLVTLIGLITKHGILLVDFANKRLGDYGVQKAILEAVRLRLRPILMTTGAMVLGSIPLAFASGPGAEARQQIGWVLVGGLSIGTVLTLFVIPTIYTFFKRGGPERL